MCFYWGMELMGKRYVVSGEIKDFLSRTASLSSCGHDHENVRDARACRDKAAPAVAKNLVIVEVDEPKMRVVPEDEVL